MPNTYSTLPPVPHPTYSAFKDLTGRRFGRLKVRYFVGIKKRSGAEWLCECDCGEITVALSGKLQTNDRQSCGCIWRNRCATPVHNTPEYKAYLDAKGRCARTKSSQYHRYGGRGIQFRFNSFTEFFAEVGIKPCPEYSLNRIDNDGHYEKGNVEWASEAAQQRNKNTSRLLTANGITKNLIDWASDLGVHHSNIQIRLKLGWCAQCALTKPFNRKRNQCTHRRAIWNLLSKESENAA